LAPDILPLALSIRIDRLRGAGARHLLPYSSTVRRVIGRALVLGRGGTALPSKGTTAAATTTTRSRTKSGCARRRRANRATSVACWQVSTHRIAAADTANAATPCHQPAARALPRCRTSWRRAARCRRRRQLPYNDGSRPSQSSALSAVFSLSLCTSLQRQTPIMRDCEATWRFKFPRRVSRNRQWQSL
jgi:hypothetical protein